jgi:hypothetical protein
MPAGSGCRSSGIFLRFAVVAQTIAAEHELHEP